MKYLSMGHQKILLFLALFILCILYFKFYFYPYPNPSEEIFREIAVEVLGEVQRPGIYTFKNPPDLKEAIEKAGGLKEAALYDKNSFSEILNSGTQITVTRESSVFHPLPPLVKAPSPSPFIKGGAGEINRHAIKIKLGRMEAHKLLVFSIPLDLNCVSVDDLCLIPGIGESLAKEILTYRERRRGFRSVQELQNVKGFGGKKWRAFRTFFMVTQPISVKETGK
jgi:competence protein ComEA